ncbi:MAG: hypothetical protein JXJ20_13835 [Anaerolineae bacterium]|nr:hypothetical protein [Anaerolineae bacterium]
MARRLNGQLPDKPVDQQRLEAEWANVGVCGGMFRPPNANDGHSGNHRPPAAAPSSSQIKVNEDDWQPHNRCCL